MSWLVVFVRRALWLALIGLAGGAIFAWWRDRQGAGPALAPAEWPPIETTTPPAREPAVDIPDEPTEDIPTEAAGAVSESGQPGDEPSADVPEVATAASASVVNALVDAPEARSADEATGGWVEPLDDGSCPVSHPIKANDNSGIFHVPGGRFYERTKAERCYADAEAAARDGYRQAKN